MHPVRFSLINQFRLWNELSVYVTWSFARPLRRSSDMLAGVQSLRRPSADTDHSHATLPTGVVQKIINIMLIAGK